MMSEKVFKICLDKGLTIAFSESVTGGSLAYELIQYPKASHIVLASIVAYQKDLKIKLLNVQEDTINTYSVVSKEVAYEMALGIYKLTSADISISVTGNAGPSLEKNTNDFKAYYTILFKNQRYDFMYQMVKNDRIKNIDALIKDIYQNLYEIIRKI